MKRLASLLIFASAALLPVFATEFVVNGDFTEGVGHWYGDARTPDDYARDNGQLSPDAFNSKGVILPLKDRDWVKLAQDFQGKISGGVVTITYQLSPNATFSTKAEDYANVPHSIKYDGWQPFGIDPGNWMLMISDFGSLHGTYYGITPKGGSGPQTIKCKVSGLTPHEDKTLTLAFPPGTGTVVLLHVSVDSGDDATPAQPDPNAIPKL